MMSETILMPDADGSLDPSADEQKEDEPSQIDWKAIAKPLGLIVGGFICIGGGRVHVFRNAYRGAYPSGIDRRRNGKGAGIGPAFGRTGVEPSQLLVIRSVVGTGKTAVFVVLVVVMVTISGQSAP